MDNIVDYLIIGFFIISFLTSIFKKKKVKAKPQKVVNTTSDSNQQKVEARGAKAKSPFDDFFKSINEELANAKKEVSRSEVDEYYEQALLNSDAAEITEQSSFQKATASPLISEVVLPEKKKSVSIKSYHESVEFSKTKRENAKSKSIKKRLLQNDSIKDFMIINEILGKPKALQR
ncbi:MAG: hypothetical protein L3J41_13235 [Melioribacteraceae bacterium]|nr:hypothetical protein [Melioribacteraceae bacterium]